MNDEKDNVEILSAEQENDESTRKAKYPVLTLEKALDIINYFKEHSSEDGISLSEICQKLDMKKSSVHRILNTLYEYNYVEKTLSGNKYKLSWSFTILATPFR